VGAAGSVAAKYQEVRMKSKRASMARMYPRRSLGGLLVGLVALSGCSTLRVESLPAPDANFSRSATFMIVERPTQVDMVRPASFSPSVMLNNPIVDQMVRAEIRRSFESRGYTLTSENPDFVVAYTARAIEQVDIDDRDYPYRYDDYPYRYNDCCYIYEFTEGAVMIDVVDPETNELLWRGSGVATVSEDPQEYMRQLSRIIDSVVDRFPRARVIYIQPDRMDEPTESYGEAV
jgi:hypothetical protein